jgi:hypothetical protein
VWHLKLDVDPVEEGPGAARQGASDLGGGAVARVKGLSEVAAGARAHRRHWGETGGIGKGGGGPRQSDDAVLQRLAQRLQAVTGELR